MLVDGNSLTYRAFYALPTDLATASGQVTNAVFGFTSMLINLLRDHRPDLIAVAFDRSEPTFRHEAEPGYKANREAAPDILRQQMGLVREVLEVMAIPTVEKPGYEADDLIATLATRARDRGDDVIVVTGDRDAYQLVEDPHVRVLYNRRGVSDYVLYDAAGIRERTGVDPGDYLHYAALRGDPSDNLPGVPGVGEKTAARLIGTYGDVDGVYAHLDELSPKLRENLAAHEDRVRTNVELMAPVRDVDLDVDLDELVWGEVDRERLRELFDFLEFRSLYDRLAELLGDGPATGSRVLEAEVTRVATVDEAVAVLGSAASGDGVLALGVPGTGVAGGLALVTDADTAEVAFVPGELLADEAVLAAVASLTAPGGRPVAMHGAKATLRHLLGRDVDVRTLHDDTRIATYLLDPADTRDSLAEVLSRLTGFELPDGGPPEGQLDLDGDTTDPALEAGRQALAVDRLVEPLRGALRQQGLERLNDEIEVPLVRVLAKMEHVGIGVDPGVLERIRDELAAEAERLRALVVADAGHDFNVNSTKQLRQVLFDELGLTPQKKTKTGFSTDAQTLEKLRGQHPIIEHLLEYREVEKLRSTYGEGLLAAVGPGNRIRATFNQTVARTGRLSSDAPNLHNIPVRSERGRIFRSAFVAPEGHHLLVADYDQIELRCIAHLAEDPGLIAAFEAGDDIHTATAARIFGIAPEEVGVEERSKAKMVSYGLAYGMEAYGLGQRLGIPTSEAAEILDAYFAAFPAVKAYMERTVAEARERGYTETLFGRRRRLPELGSPNPRLRQAAERQAMNAGIQGLAADIFKVALVRLDARLEERSMGSRIVLQVHDEIIVEVPDDEIDEARELVRDTMENAFELRVPLAVALSVGRTWADAKG